MSRVFRALIIDDEPGARRLIRDLLAGYHEIVEICGEAENGRQAIQQIHVLRPDLIFLDIQMTDLSGFEVIEQLEYQPNIIFTTAYEHYALKAFETFSIDYLLKPIKPERLDQSLSKLAKFGRLDQAMPQNALTTMIQEFKSLQKPTALAIRIGDRIILLRYENIVFLQAGDKYVFVFTEDGQKYLTDQSLHSLSARLPDHFYRIQKSYIINKEKIKEMHRHFNARYLFIMNDKDNTRLTSGRTYYDEIKKEFGLD